MPWFVSQLGKTLCCNSGHLLGDIGLRQIMSKVLIKFREDSGVHITMHRGIRPLRFIHEKKQHKGLKKLCLEVQIPSFLSQLHLIIAGIVFLTAIFIHFAPFRSGVQNPFCHFFMDEPQGSYSPVHGALVADSCDFLLSGPDVT